MSYILYKKPSSKLENDGQDKIDVRVIKLSFFKLFIPEEKFDIKTFTLRLYFSLITFNKTRIFYVVKNGVVAHYSYVIPKCFKFPFLKENDYEIGPCQTKKEFRGQGLYPMVLKKIVATEFSSSNYFMIVHESNVCSIKGIKKAGFVECGRVEKGVFKIYKESAACV